ncbi:hypothetical protein EXIGLDRAFT_735030 [Exidia glandulosa HHB12029]|uniref:Uncharacterized protein n=1 Tax=Exidia glandulosa HHB12029 TaxID=1314781 RepID=A0A165K105_EXIGL|nr:hypothetical protein EXIGLDRAFT_735030 [Exidia glandulosa HHB12029]
MQITEQLGSLSLSAVTCMTSPTSPYFPSVPLPTEVNAWWAPFFDESQLPIDFASTSPAPAQSSQGNACQIDWSIQPF